MTTASVQRSIRLLAKTASDLDRISGSKGEIFYDLTNDSLRVFDGQQTGGNLLGAGLTLEETQDLIAAMFTSGVTHSGVTTQYIDSSGKIRITGFSGSYNDLTNKPTIPSGQVQSDWNATTGVSAILNKPTLFSGSYNDLTNLPTIPGEVNLTGYATETYVGTQISTLIGTAGTALNTLGELSDALNDDANFASTVTTSIGLKAPIASPSFTGSTLTLANNQKLVWGGSTGPWISSAGVGYALQMGWQTGTTNLTFDSSNVTVSGANLTIGAYGETGSIYWANGFGRMYANTSGGNRLTIEGPTDNGSGNTGQAASVTLIPGSTSGGTPGTVRIVGLTSVDDLTFTGTATLQQTAEVLNTKSAATGTVTHDFSTGAIWHHTAPSSNFTVNLTNVPTTVNRTIVATLIIQQGLTPYIPNAFQVDGSSISINWLGGTAPSGNSLKFDLVSFTLIIRSGALPTLLGSLSTYG